MSQTNMPSGASRTSLKGQRFVAICAAAVVLLLAFTFIGISQASRLGVQALERHNCHPRRQHCWHGGMRR